MVRTSRLGLLVTTCLCLLGGAAHAAAADPAYPVLDDKEMGQVRNIVELARQPDGEWRDMEVGVRNAFDAYQFQIAWMYYALAVAQSQQTPAYRELYQASSNDLIRKMTRNDVWGWWQKVIDAPRFKKYLDQTKDWRDPVREKNIMYSGHLLQMIGLYELLYRDQRYDAPGFLTFAITDANPFVHKYNHEDLAQIIHRQFVDSQFTGVECEPNLVFAECNQHPVLGLMNYDQVHGGNLADIRQAFWDKAMALGFLDQKKTQRFTGPYLLAEQTLISNPSGWNDGWTGVTLHAWNKDLVKQVYPAQRDATVPALLDTNPDAFKVRWNQASVSSDYGFMAALAAEVGDHATAQRMLDFADAKFRPQWRNGRYVYPTNDVKVPGGPMFVTGDELPGDKKDPPKPLSDDQIGEYQVGPLNGNALLAFARLNPGEGLWRLNNDLASTYVVDGPEVVGVDYPKVLVSQAYFDQARGVLAVAVKPGTEYRGEVSFRVRNLPRSGVYAVLLDGEPVATVKGRRIDVTRPGAISAAWAQASQLSLAFQLQEGRRLRIEGLTSRRVASR
ncbi:hypothetical protein [Phenylobacterium sp.]|uniref:linalool dehydratase/isomerase domain-containing protein n=1 Tax=Phenylobacterium sp. TaxID=1871053 RepID=UPI0035AE8F82